MLKLTNKHDDDDNGVWSRIARSVEMVMVEAGCPRDSVYRSLSQSHYMYDDLDQRWIISPPISFRLLLFFAEI